MDTRDTIVAAAWSCIQERGVKGANIAEIARRAGLSRATVYLHFSDKTDLVDAVIAGVSAAIFKRMGRAMAQGSDLRAQLALAAAFIARTRKALHDGQEHFDPSRAAAVLADQTGEALARAVVFFDPYVRAAQDRGEIRPELDTRAVSEWFARILFSLYVTPSSVLDLEDPTTAARFVSDHFVIAAPDPNSIDEARSAIAHN